MKSLAVTLFIALLAAATPALADSYGAVDREDIYRTRVDRFGHLQYVGFYASALQHWNLTEELAPFTNLTWIETSNIDNIILRLQEARDNGVQAVLSVQPLLFDPNIQLRDNYLARLGDLQQRILFDGLMDQVAMVYSIDEPLARAAKSDHTTRGQMYRDLEAVHAELAILFPDKPLGVIFSHGEILRDDFRVLETFDWVGFDCYHSLYDCDDRPMTTHYRILLDRMQDHQRLMAVPQAWIRYRDYEQGDYEPDVIFEARKTRLVKNLRKRFKHHYEIALSEPRFVAFIPFTWSMEPAPGKPPRPGFGVDRMAEMFPDGGQAFVDLVTGIAGQIVTGTHKYPNMSLKQTEPHLRRPREDRYEARIIDVAHNGLVSAWGVNKSLPHKNLRMQLALYQGDEIVYLSGIKRSFILDESIRTNNRPRLPHLGVHGYRHKVPKELLQALRGENVTVEVRVYGDRNGPQAYFPVREEVVL